MALHEDQKNRNRIHLSGLNIGIQALGLTDANVAAADTNVGLQAAITAKTPHGELDNIEIRVNRGIEHSNNLGVLTDAAILGLTTTLGAQTLFSTADSAIADLDARVGIPMGG